MIGLPFRVGKARFRSNKIDIGSRCTKSLSFIDSVCLTILTGSGDLESLDLRLNDIYFSPIHISSEILIQMSRRSCWHLISILTIKINITANTVISTK